MPAARAVTDPAIPGLVPAQRSGSAAPAAKHAHEHRPAPTKGRPRRPAHARARPRTRGRVPGPHAPAFRPGDAAIPGLSGVSAPGSQGTAYRRHHPSPARAPVSETRLQQAFISQIAPGAIAAQHRYGVPAAVTIAQAIDESGWGQSELAAHDHNLFGIKGTGPAGSVPLPTQEYVNGQPVSTSASFRVYHNVAESIDDHGRLLARSGYYQQAMADRQHPDKFAAALTGVYATDPNYGANLISLMRRYDLYRYQAPDHGQPGHEPAAAAPGGATIPGVPAGAPAPAGPPRPASPPSPSPRPTRTASPRPTRTASPQPTRTASPQPTQTQSPQPTATGSPGPSPASSPEPTGTTSPQPARTATPSASAPQSPRPAASPRRPPRAARARPPRAARAPPQANPRPRTRRAGRRGRVPGRRPPRRPHPRNRRSREW